MLPTPAGLLVRLLGIFSSRDEANAAVGDILEELVERNASDLSPRSPRLWVNLQTIRAIGTTIVAGVPRMIRSSGLILRDATRALRAAPATSLFVILVLAIGVTAGTVTFSVVDAVVLRPLPVEQPDRLVSIPTRDADYKERITPEVFWRLHDHLDSVEVLAPRMTFSGSNVTVGSISDEWPMMYTSADIFRVLRWTPAIGRYWTADDEAMGDTDVAVLGYRFWREKFQGDASVIGETVTSGKRRYRVIGVLPAASDHPELDLTSTPIWVPRVVPRAGQAGPFNIIARMRPGVSVAQVASEIQQLAEAPDWHPAVMPLHETYVASVRRWMLLALGAAALVVLIACVNAANLMLTRSARRAQEMAIRASLGASRRQIAVSVLAEGLLLSLAATGCALLLSLAGVRLARIAVTTMLSGVFRASAISLNLRVLAMAITAAVVTGIVVSLVPAWQTSRASLSSLVKDAEGTTATGRRRWRSLFLIAEVAAVGVLMVVSWLFIVSLIRVVGIDLGINRANLLAVDPRGEFQGSVDDVQRRIEGVPGVSGVAVSIGTSLPLIGRAYSGAYIDTTVRRADGDQGTGVRPPVKVLQYRVTPNYFDVAGLSFQRGGTWSSEAVLTSPAVVLDERAAKQLFGDENPIGRPVSAGEPAAIFTVVGTVPYVYVRGPEEVVEPAVYFPLKPNPTRKFASLFVKTTRPADEMVTVLAEALKPFAPLRKGPLVRVADEALGKITATRRFNAGLMSAFGLVGLLIGMAGVYAVMASFVAQQTREIGVRMALGATPSRIQRGVMALAWRHLLVGLAIGLPIAWWLSRGFATLLFQVTPADASVYAGVAALLSVVGFLAAWIPARRASRIDPIVSLRT